MDFEEYRKNMQGPFTVDTSMLWDIFLVFRAFRVMFTFIVSTDMWISAVFFDVAISLANAILYYPAVTVDPERVESHQQSTIIKNIICCIFFHLYDKLIHFRVVSLKFLQMDMGISAWQSDGIFESPLLVQLTMGSLKQ